MKNFFALILVLGMFSSAAFAGPPRNHSQPQQQTSVQPISPNQGSDACGLGWQVTDKKTLVATTTRSTTNHVVSYSFGMTSGTLGCEQHTFSKNEREAAVYAATNIEPLSIEMAEGRGEFLQGFARTMGCDDAVIEQFGQMTQENYDSLIQTSNGIQMFKSVQQHISQDPVLSAGCSTSTV